MGVWIMQRIVLISCAMLAVTLSGQHKPWTWQYQWSFSSEQMIQHAMKKELILSKTDTPAFTQLIFSWNALRPRKGHYAFYVQVRSKKKQCWSKWHKAVEWGARVQKSYESSADDVCRYVYVRLETENGDKADAFRIKVIAHDTDMSGIKHMIINISDLTEFTYEQIIPGTFASVMMPNVPQKSQLILEHENNRMMCSPTSCSMLLEYIMEHKIDPLEFAERAYDHGLCAYGSWPFNMAHAFECAGENVLCYATRLPSFAKLHEKLIEGIPVAVSVRGMIVGAPKEYENGHLLVVIGYDAALHKIICHDPAAPTNEQTLKEYDMHSFMRAWDRSRRLSYIISSHKRY